MSNLRKRPKSQQHDNRWSVSLTVRRAGPPCKAFPIVGRQGLKPPLYIRPRVALSSALGIEPDFT